MVAGVVTDLLVLPEEALPSSNLLPPFLGFLATHETVPFVALDEVQDILDFVGSQRLKDLSHAAVVHSDCVQAQHLAARVPSESNLSRGDGFSYTAITENGQ